MRIDEIQRVSVGSGIEYDAARRRLYLGRESKVTLRVLRRLREIRRRDEVRRAQKGALLALMYRQCQERG